MLPDGPADPCAICAYVSLGYAFDRAGVRDSAIGMYERYVETPFSARWTRDRWHLAGVLKRLGELYEARGDRERAARHYTRFVELWRDADPELQPQVSAVRQRLTRLRRPGGSR